MSVARTLEDLLAEANLLPPPARRELRDRIDQSLGRAAGQPPEGRLAESSDDKGPYASLLALAGTAQSEFPDVARNKNKHLADIYARKRAG